MQVITRLRGKLRTKTYNGAPPEFLLCSGVAPGLTRSGKSSERTALFRVGSATIEKVPEMDLNGMLLQQLMPAFDP